MCSGAGQMSLESWRKSVAESFARYGSRLLCGFCCSFILIPNLAGQKIRLKDNTDWWSINNEGFRRSDLKARNANIQPETFEILGIVLGKHEFERIATRLGKATVVSRGDAS